MVKAVAEPNSWSLCSLLQLGYLLVFLREVWRKEEAREESSLADYMTGGKG